MNKKSSARLPEMLSLKGESGKIEKVALLCDLFMLAVFIWNQIRYGMNMLFLIIPLSILGAYFIFDGIVPEEYCFLETKLEIRHLFRKSTSIYYDSIFNYEATKKDSFIDIGQNNKVKLYYLKNKEKKTAAVCRPKDIDSFVETVKKKCPVFREESSNKSRLEVFFNSSN